MSTILLAMSLGCAPADLVLKRPDGSVIRQYSAPRGQAEYFTNDDPMCVASTHVSFRHDVLPPLSSAPPLPTDGLAELYLFSRDPLALDDRLASLTDDDLRAGRWDAIASGIPKPALLQYPPRPEGSSTAPIEVDLSQRTFWPTGPDPSFGPDVMCSPFGASGPVAGGRLPAALVFQRGLCSADVDMTVIMKRFFDTFFTRFKEGVTFTSLDPPAKPLYGRLITLLDRTGQTPAGGFQMSFHFDYTHASLDGSVWGTYRFELQPPASTAAGSFQVTPGGLGLNATEIVLHSSGGYADGVQADVHDKLIHSSEPFRATLASQMAVPTELQPCSRWTDCQKSADDLGSLITLEKLRAAGMPNATAADLAHLQCIAGVYSVCKTIPPDGPYAGALIARERWQCLQTSDTDTDLVCKYVLAPKRFYVAPDHLSLVWFDEPDLDNPQYALFVAYGAQHAYVTTMCGSHPAEAETVPFQRDLSTVVVNGATCQAGSRICFGSQPKECDGEGHWIDEGAPCTSPDVCYAGQCCTPACAGRACGDDGCGGSCGACRAGQKCNSSGRCVGCDDSCNGRCHQNGCGRWCGTCGKIGDVCDEGGCRPAH